MLLQPIEVVVVLKAALVEQVFEDLSQGIIVWPFLEAEIAYMLHISDKFDRDLMTEFFKCHLTLLGANHLVLGFLISDLHSLPRQVAPHEIDKNEPEALKVISAGLLLAEVGIQTSISRCARQTFIITIGNMFVRSGILISFS